ncbi:unnamed protein product [Amoebophrya sp. A120]|nr:unnamed protein product [Amoebophrya sp. A120]|eukprot:GSA120T00015187001.1
MELFDDAPSAPAAPGPNFDFLFPRDSSEGEGEQHDQKAASRLLCAAFREEHEDQLSAFQGSGPPLLQFQEESSSSAIHGVLVTNEATSRTGGRGSTAGGGDNQYAFLLGAATNANGNAHSAGRSTTTGGTAAGALDMLVARSSSSIPVGTTGAMNSVAQVVSTCPNSPAISTVPCSLAGAGPRAASTYILTCAALADPRSASTSIATAATQAEAHHDLQIIAPTGAVGVANSPRHLHLFPDSENSSEGGDFDADFPSSRTGSTLSSREPTLSTQVDEDRISIRTQELNPLASVEDVEEVTISIKPGGSAAETATPNDCANHVRSSSCADKHKQLASSEPLGCDMRSIRLRSQDHILHLGATCSTTPGGIGSEQLRDFLSGTPSPNFSDRERETLSPDCGFPRSMEKKLGKECEDKIKETALEIVVESCPFSGVVKAAAAGALPRKYTKTSQGNTSKPAAFQHRPELVRTGETDDLSNNDPNAYSYKKSQEMEKSILRFPEAAASNANGKNITLSCTAQDVFYATRDQERFHGSKFTVDPLSFMAPSGTTPSATPTGGSNTTPKAADAFAAIPASATPVAGAEDPFAAADPGKTALKEWEADQDAKNQKKAQQELETKKKRREEAKADLAKWYADRKTALEKKKAANRHEEKEWLAIQNASGAGKNPWERVLSMISDNAAATKADSAVPPLQDTSRFKQVLIQLKSNPVPN